MSNTIARPTVTMSATASLLFSTCGGTLWRPAANNVLTRSIFNLMGVLTYGNARSTSKSACIARYAHHKTSPDQTRYQCAPSIFYSSSLSL